LQEKKMDKMVFKIPLPAGIVIGAALAGCAASGPQNQAGMLRAQILVERPAPLTHLNVQSSLNVKDFGAVADDGKDDRAAVAAAIEKARSMDGPVRIDFNPGVYDFSAEAPDFSNGATEAALPLHNCANLIVDGHGAQILIHRQDVSFAGVHTSTNLIVRNFSIDYDPLPFSQGTVEQIAPAGLSFVMKLHPGFPPPDDPFFKSCGSWGMLKDTEHPGRLKADCPAHFFYKEIVPLGGGRFRVLLGSELEMTHVEPGDVFVINGRSASIGRYFASENITFEHLTAFACPGAVFVGAQTSQLNVLNCKVLLKGNRLITAGADGVHCQAARIGPWIENCEFEGLSDDCLNIYGLPIYVLEQVSPTQMTVYARAAIHPGDTLVFFNPTAGKVLQETTVVSYAGAARREASDIVYPKGTLILSDPVEPLNIAPTGTPLDARGWKNYDHAYNVDAIGNRFVYRNNYMHDGRRYGLFIKASRGLVEDNVFEGLSCNGMQIANEPDWPEGFWVRDLVIQNNRISECGYGRGDPPIAIVAEKLRGHMDNPMHRNIYLLNNVLDAVSGPALKVSGVSGLTAEGNTFTSRTENGPLIDFQYSENVQLNGNQGQDRIEMRHMDESEVRSTGK
jgi:hypothetical protein